MESPCCKECGGSLRPSDIKYERYICIACTFKKRVAFLLSDAFVDNTFTKLWTKGLFKRLGIFLERHEIPVRTQAQMLARAAALLQEAEQSFLRLGDVDEEWLEERIKKIGKYLSPTFFRAFLIEEHILSSKNRDEKKLEAIQAKLALIPQQYRRLVEVYFQEQITLRERHIQQHAKQPLAVKTIVHKFMLFQKLIRWLLEQMPDLSGWEMVQEEHIHAFLLTLQPTHRELTRKDLYQFFRLGRKKKVVTHVPVMNLPSRELPRTIEPLTMDEQKALARLIRDNIYSQPEEAFLAALCFYHGLSTSQIRGIRTSDVDVERGVLHLKARLPLYLLAEDFLLLEQFLLKRKTLPYAKTRSYLFISNQAKFNEQPVPEQYVPQRVRALTGHTPRCLRITCFTAMSARYGPQYLIEAFGLSLTHASRYGNLKEYLLEEELQQQKEDFAELSRQLGRRKKQQASRSQGKKEDENHGSTEQ
jgi:integrase